MICYLQMGKSEVIDVYHDDGITITTKHLQSGATLTEEWRRVCSEEGAYKYAGNEGGEEFFRASGDRVEGMTFEEVMRGNVIKMEDLGDDCWQLTENIMGQTVSMKITMNEEVENPSFEQKMVWTRYTNNNKLRLCDKTKFIFRQGGSKQGQGHHQKTSIPS